MAFELNAPSKIKSITSAYSGPRFRNGRPKVDDDIVERMKRVTIEEAWGVLMGKGHSFQFEGDWINLHPNRVLVGRAVTARYIPHRPDFNDVVNAEGERHGRIGGQNSWVIDTLVANDVLVIDLFGKVLRGTFIGDNLGTAIAANTDGTGLVVDGGHPRRSPRAPVTDQRALQGAASLGHRRGDHGRDQRPGAGR